MDIQHKQNPVFCIKKHLLCCIQNRTHGSFHCAHFPPVPCRRGCPQPGGRFWAKAGHWLEALEHVPKAGLTAHYPQRSSILVCTLFCPNRIVVILVCLVNKVFEKWRGREKSKGNTKRERQNKRRRENTFQEGRK